MEQSKLTGFDSFSVNTNLIANRQTKARERANKRSDKRQIAIISNVNFEWVYELFASELEIYERRLYNLDSKTK